MPPLLSPYVHTPTRQNPAVRKLSQRLPTKMMFCASENENFVITKTHDCSWAATSPSSGALPPKDAVACCVWLPNAVGDGSVTLRSLLGAGSALARAFSNSGLMASAISTVDGASDGSGRSPSAPTASAAANFSSTLGSSPPAGGGIGLWHHLGSQQARWLWVFLRVFFLVSLTISVYG